MAIELKYDWKRKTDQPKFGWDTGDAAKDLGKTSVGLKFKTRLPVNDTTTFDSYDKNSFFADVTKALNLEDYNDFLSGDWWFSRPWKSPGKEGERWFDFSDSDSTENKFIVYSENIEFTIIPTDGKPVYEATEWQLSDITYTYAKGK